MESDQAISEIVKAIKNWDDSLDAAFKAHEVVEKIVAGKARSNGFVVVARWLKSKPVPLKSWNYEGNSLFDVVLRILVYPRRRAGKGSLVYRLCEADDQIKKEETQ
jgi:hypothetical protein